MFSRRQDPLGRGAPGLRGGNISTFARVLPICVATLLCSMGRGALFLLVPLRALELGGIFSAFAVPGMLAVGSVLVNVPAAWAVSRFGDKSVMLVGLLAGLAGSITVALTDSLFLMGGALFVYGVGMGVWGLARLVHLVETVPSAERGRAIAPVGGMHRVGMFVAPGLAGVAAESLGQQITLLACAGLVFVSWVVIGVLVSESEVHRSEARRPLQALGQVLRRYRGTLVTVGLAMWALALLRAARVLLLPVCGSALGLDTSSIGFAKSASAFADVALSYPAGQIMDRRGRKWTAVPCLLTLSVGVAVIGWADGFVTFLVGGVVAGLGNGLGSGVNMTLAGDFAPDDARADFIGVWRLVTDGGGALSPFVIGAVAHTAALGPASLVPCLIGLFGAFVLGTRVREPLERATATPVPRVRT